MEIITYFIYAIGFALFGLMIYVALPLYRSGSTMSIWSQLVRMLVLTMSMSIVMAIFIGEADELSEIFNETSSSAIASGVFALLALRAAQALYKQVSRFDYRQLIEYVAINLGCTAGFFASNIANHLVLGDELVWNATGIFSAFVYIDLYIILVIANVVAFMRLLSNFQEMGIRTEQAERNREVEQLKAAADRSKLQAIQARLNPHFLYNSLNSLASQIASNPAAAEKMSLDLARMFRELLDRQGEGPVLVHEAIDVLRTYLDIEKTRFGDKLSYQLSVSEEAASWKMPRFLMQPIVENAVIHGRPSDGSMVQIEVDAKVNHGRLVLTVSDNGGPFPSPIPGGFGLQSVSDTLELCYPDAYELEFRNPPEKAVVVSLKNKSPLQ
jgi:sensor histidine kinase YesM